ncbi:MAG: hypothetical protein M1457_03205 [bacterium]|nr:hypothetical protein [bacterium]
MCQNQGRLGGTIQGSTTATALLDIREMVKYRCPGAVAPANCLFRFGENERTHRRERQVHRIVSRKRWPDPSTWGVDTPAPAGGRTLSVFDVTARQLVLIARSLNRMPVSHIQAIPRIVADFRVGPVGTGTVRTGGNTRPASPGVRGRGVVLESQAAMEISYHSLNADCADLLAGEPSIQNWYDDPTHLCTTLYHEAGHCIDVRYGFMRSLSRANYNYMYNWFRGLVEMGVYRGNTRSSGEAIAEANRYLHARQLRGRNATYSGTEYLGARVREIVLNHPVYHDVLGEFPPEVVR